MADDAKIPPTDDDITVAKTEELPVAEAPIEDADTGARKAEYVPVGTTREPTAARTRRKLDVASVIVTVVAIAALAAAFGIGYAVGDHHDGGGRGHGDRRMERFGGSGMRGGPGGGMRGGFGRGDSDQGGFGQRDRGFDRGFRGPGSDVAPGALGAPGDAPDAGGSTDTTPAPPAKS